MFHHLSYEVTFPTTARKLSADVDLSTGLGAIIGPNESGKSMVLEMLRFSLYGTAALRGSAADYRTLKVEAEFTARGHRWQVKRTITRATLQKDGADEATGVSAVNGAILRLLGFNLAVFDVACAANQGEIERLGSMKPAERQKLVDSVVGLDKIDALGRWCAEEASLRTREADGLLRGLLVPTEPVEPECYCNRSAIEAFLELAEKDNAELLTVTGALSAPATPAPVKPQCSVDQTVEELEEQEVALRASQASLAGVEAELAVMPPVVDVDALEAQVAAHEAYVRAQVFIRQNPLPEFDEIALAEMRQRWADRDRLHLEHAAYDEDQAHVRRHAALVARGVNECPECAHTWALEADAISEVEGKILNLPKPDPIPPAPRISLPAIERMETQWADIDIKALEEAQAVPVARDIGIHVEDLPRYRDAVERRGGLEAQRLQLRSEIERLSVVPGQLRDRRTYETAAALYDHQVELYEADQERRQALEARKVELDYAPERMKDLRPVVARFAPYERELAEYQRVRVIYDERKAEAAELMTAAEGWRKAREALFSLRGLIKQHLIPSLNLVASRLLVNMTGGQRRSIYVDETFDVQVDGQPLDTLSGSGKACANLALRIGLGQVLTSGVFSVFLADEIDASMDQFRSEKTAEVLQTLTRFVSQVLLVSHKTPTADYYIELGGMSAFTPTEVVGA